MHIFEKVWGVVHFVGVHVEEGFKKLFGEKAAQDFAHASLELLKSAAGQIVLEVVQALMTAPNLSGDQKRTAAFDASVSKLGSMGLTLGKEIATSEINLLIETSVAALSGKFGPAAGEAAITQ